MTTDTLMDDFFASVSFDKTQPWQDTPATFVDDEEGVQMSAILKFNPNHEPAGSPKGGQFAHAYDQTRADFAGENAAEYRALLDEYLSHDKAPPELQDRVDAAMRQKRALNNEWTRQTSEALSLGDIDEKTAKARGFYGNNGSSPYEPLPPKLYHVTTAATDVAKHGLKTRDELSQTSGVGLGGGTSDTISFAVDKKVAEDIHSAMLLARDYMAGDITTEQMVETARKDGFLEKMALYYGSGAGNYPGTDVPFGAYEALHSKVIELYGAGFTNEMLEWKRTNNTSASERKNLEGMKVTHTLKDRNLAVVERDATPEEAQRRREEFLKKWLAAREAVTKQLDPLFFSSNLIALGQTKREEIQLMEFAPRSKKAMGYQVSALSEWRTHTGKAVKRVKVKKFNPNHDERGRFTTSENAAAPDEFAYLTDKNRSPIEGMSPHMNAISTLAIVSRLGNVSEDEPVKSLLGKIIEAVDGNAPRLDFVHRYGKPMEVNGSDDIRTPHRCYNNSVDVIVESMLKPDSPRVDYVEGIVTEHGIPLAHAWNREGSRMVDHTVPDPWNHQYMGLVVPRRVMMDVMTASSFGRTKGEGVIGAIMHMKDKKRRDRYLRLIMEANQ